VPRGYIGDHPERLMANSLRRHPRRRRHQHFVAELSAGVLKEEVDPPAEAVDLAFCLADGLTCLEVSGARQIGAALHHQICKAPNARGSLCEGGALPGWLRAVCCVHLLGGLGEGVLFQLGDEFGGGGVDDVDHRLSLMPRLRRPKPEQHARIRLRSCSRERPTWWSASAASQSLNTFALLVVVVGLF